MSYPNNKYEDELRNYISGGFSWQEGEEEDFYEAEGDEEDFYDADGYEYAEGEEDFYDADGDEYYDADGDEYYDVDGEDYYDAEGEEYDDYEDDEDEYEQSGGGVDGEDDRGASFDGEDDDYDTGDDIDNVVYEVDFSQFDGEDFASALNGVNKRVSTAKRVRKESRTSGVRKAPVKKGVRRVEKRGTQRPRQETIRTARPSTRRSERPTVKRGVKPTIRRSERPTEKKVLKPTAKRMVRSTAKPMGKPMPRPKQKPISKKVASPTDARPRRMIKPMPKRVGVRENQSATIIGKKGCKTTKRVIVPPSQKVIVEGVDKFILSKGKQGDNVKNIGYYKGKKLKELVLTINNNSLLDFNLELFNPSEPLDYLFSTSGNLNNKIQVSGGIVSYSDVLFNILANPTHLVNAKFTFSGATYLNQINQPLIFKNKAITGEQIVEPMQLALKVDNMQVIQEIVFFDIYGALNRPFIPNGMDVIQYKVLAGNTVTFAFFYEQKDLRKFFYKEARDSKKLL